MRFTLFSLNKHKETLVNEASSVLLENLGECIGCNSEQCDR
jgi:hypothetical protein